MFDFYFVERIINYFLDFEYELCDMGKSKIKDF